MIVSWEAQITRPRRLYRIRLFRRERESAFSSTLSPRQDSWAFTLEGARNQARRMIQAGNAADGIISDEHTIMEGIQ